jgi:hypothetical protein
MDQFNSSYCEVPLSAGCAERGPVISDFFDAHCSPNQTPLLPSPFHTVKAVGERPNPRSGADTLIGFCVGGADFVIETAFGTLRVTFRKNAGL